MKLVERDWRQRYTANCIYDLSIYSDSLTKAQLLIASIPLLEHP